MADRPGFVPVKPDGTRWQRSFRSEEAAWRAIVRGCNSAREARERRAQLVRDGWTVANQAAVAPPAISPDPLPAQPA